MENPRDDKFREYLEETSELHSELFPSQMIDGYRFYGMTYSQKQIMKLRRFQLLSSGEVYQLRPDFVRLYIIGKTDEVEKVLYLRRYGVSFMALLWDFHAYTQRTRSANSEQSSPFGELNGFVYYDNWLYNLLIAGSMNGYIPRSKSLNRIQYNQE